MEKTIESQDKLIDMLYDDLEEKGKKIYSLEKELRSLRRHRNELQDKNYELEKSKEKRSLYLKNLQDISDKRNDEFANLQSSIKSLKTERKQRCKFGWGCKRRAVCNFDHVYLYKKVNILESPVQMVSKDFPCEICGKTFKTTENLEGHIDKHHKAPSPVLGLQDSRTNSTMKQKNVDMKEDFECNKCRKYFVSKDELENHVELEHSGNKFAHLEMLALIRSLVVEPEQKEDEKKPSEANVKKKMEKLKKENKPQQSKQTAKSEPKLVKQRKTKLKNKMRNIKLIDANKLHDDCENVEDMDSNENLSESDSSEQLSETDLSEDEVSDSSETSKESENEIDDDLIGQ